MSTYQPFDHIGIPMAHKKAVEMVTGSRAISLPTTSADGIRMRKGKIDEGDYSKAPDIILERPVLSSLEMSTQSVLKQNHSLEAVVADPQNAPEYFGNVGLERLGRVDMKVALTAKGEKVGELKVQIIPEGALITLGEQPVNPTDGSVAASISSVEAGYTGWKQEANSLATSAAKKFMDKYRTWNLPQLKKRTGDSNISSEAVKNQLTVSDKDFVDSYLAGMGFEKDALEPIRKELASFKNADEKNYYKAFYVAMNNAIRLNMDVGYKVEGMFTEPMEKLAIGKTDAGTDHFFFGKTLSGFHLGYGCLSPNAYRQEETISG